jgi:uncharacterized heparinase superfamily protein
MTTRRMPDFLGSAAALRLSRGMDRLHARLAGRAAVGGGLSGRLEPSGVGAPALGRALVEGSFRLAGHAVRTRGRSIWDVAPPLAELADEGWRGPDPAFEAARHGFDWLPDLAALGTEEARALAQGWMLGWVERHGRGAGPGWTAAIAGRRVSAWIDHADFALGPEAAEPAALRALGRQAAFLRRRWRAAPPGRGRIDAAAGLLRAALVLDALAPAADAAAQGLAEAAGWIDAAGAVPSRSPEELAAALARLAAAAAALRDARRPVPPGLCEAMARGSATLRALRHADGGLARFHGGGAGAPGLADRALLDGRTRPAPRPLAMGFARLKAGRTTVIVDAAPPPLGPGSEEAHASTLALEVTSGRRPIVVSCGPGGAFGPAWRRAGRATASHSTLDLDGISSSRVVPGGAADALLVEGPVEVRRERHVGADGLSLKVSHDGWRATHGLTHARELDLAPEGGVLRGEDTLAALTDADVARLDAELARRAAEGVAGLLWRLRFHLHPGVEARMMRGGVVSLALASGEGWRFEHDGAAEFGLEPSVHLEPRRGRPVRIDQIVLSARSTGPVARVRWSLSRETGAGARDHEPADD